MQAEPTDTDLLRRVPFFDGLDDEALAALAERSKRRKFRGGVSLFHQGDPGETLYVVLSGGVRVQTAAPGDQAVFLAQRGPGEVVGELALIDGEPRMADAATSEPTELLVLRREDFVGCIERSPHMALAVMTSLARRLREAGEHLERQQVKDVLGRVAGALVRLLDEQGADAQDGGLRLRARVSQPRLATELGTTRESVNRAFARLKRAGIVRVEGDQVVITNPEKLRQYQAR